MLHVPKEIQIILGEGTGRTDSYGEKDNWESTQQVTLGKGAMEAPAGQKKCSGFLCWEKEREQVTKWRTTQGEETDPESNGLARKTGCDGTCLHPTTLEAEAGG